MRSFLLIVAFLLFMASMDLYTLRGLRIMGLFPAGGPKLPQLIYWGIHLWLFAAMVWAGIRFQNQREPSVFLAVTVIMGLFLMLYLPKLLFNLGQLAADLTSVGIRLVNSLSGGGQGAVSVRNWFLFPGAAMGLLLMISIAWGMLHGRTHVKIFQEEVRISRLPEQLSGLRIVQLSDLHLAGFYRDPGYIEKVVERVNGLDPHMICFTGDLVHNFAEEADRFTGILSEMKAPLGKYAVLGNHDYGTYYRWDSGQEMQENLARVKDQFRAAGFDLLLNEHRTVEQDGGVIEVVGVENWGKPPFPQRGDLEKAMEGTSPGRPTVLLSHDPSHWDLKVRGMEEIELTLSGHTHGMQMGIEWGRLRWSPSRWVYRYWAGLYQENGQYLYVNRGLGFTGFPGRVGIRPEITLITLRP